MKTFTIDDFFSKMFETESTNILLDKTYFSSSLMEEYVYQLMNFPLEDYISYLQKHPIKEEITPRDITQLSSIKDCTANMCRIMLQNENRGLTLTEIAIYLREDSSYKDNHVALTKYGENQVKTASQMGLVVNRQDHWYLSAVGYIILNLPDDVQTKFYSINLLRDPFYSRVIRSMIEKDTNLKDFMMILSESTQKRRSSSCQKVLDFFIKQSKLEGLKLHILEFKT